MQAKQFERINFTFFFLLFLKKTHVKSVYDTGYCKFGCCQTRWKTKSFKMNREKSIRYLILSVNKFGGWEHPNLPVIAKCSNVRRQGWSLELGVPTCTWTRLTKYGQLGKAGPKPRLSLTPLPLGTHREVPDWIVSYCADQSEPRLGSMDHNRVWLTKSYV